jgi:co-chaperonin GroES (HSP10)
MSTVDSELLEGQARRDAVDQLIRRLEDPALSAEEQLAAQEKLDWFAHEITEWFRPVGYKILVYIPYLQAKMESKLYMGDASRQVEQTASIRSVVLALGPLAYADEKRYPKGPWCKEGDTVLMRAYSGTRFRRTGYPFDYALINDDTVDGVMDAELKIERPV